MLYYVRCVSTPGDFFGDVSVNIVETERVLQAIDKATQGRAQFVSAPPGGTVAGLSLSPAAQLGCDPSPAQKDDSTLRLVTFCSRAVSVGNAGSRWGKTWDARGAPSRRAPAQGPFRRSQLCTLCWPALLAPPLAVRSGLGPQVTASSDGPEFQKEVSYTIGVDALEGLSKTVHDGTTPVRGGGFCLRGRSPNVGSGIQCDEGTDGFRESGLCSHRCGHGGACGIRVPRRYARRSMDAK